MTKQQRAPLIVHQVLAEAKARGRCSGADNPFVLSGMIQVSVEGRWRALIRTLEEDISRPGAARQGAGEPRLLTLEVGGELKFSAVLTHSIELKVFRPGPWEIWFHTFDGLDNEDYLA